MAIDTMDALFTAISGASTYHVFRDVAAASLTLNDNGFQSMWTEGGTPRAGAVPTTAASCDRTTSGAVPLPAPDSGKTWRLCHAAWRQSAASGLRVALFDRLAHIGGLSMAIATAQTVNLAVPARHTNYSTVWAVVESYAPTSVSTNWGFTTMSYTNQNGVAGRSATYMFSSHTRPRGWMSEPFSLQTGDSGIQSIQSIDLGTASSGTAGDFGVTLLRPIFFDSSPFTSTSSAGGNGRSLSWASLPLVDLGASPCLFTALHYATSWQSGPAQVVMHLRLFQA